MKRGVFQQRAEKAKSNISLRFHLIRFLVVFLAIAVFVTWLFQVGLLNLVYERVRRKDMSFAAAEIAANLGSEQLSQTVYAASMDGLMNVLVYHIDEEHARLIASEAPMDDAELVSLVSANALSELYEKAVRNEGTYQTQWTFGGKEVKLNLFHRLFPRIFVKSESFVDREMVHLVHAQLCADEQGNQYMILLNSSLEPMTPLVHTLQRQFLWIFVILLLLSLAFVIPMSKRIARPLVHMNEAAKQLANGNYDADFHVERGYRETKELAETLNYAAQELSKSDRLQKELTANISHDLRTPLTMIRGYAEVMRDIPEENTPENLQILIDETQRLTELVNDLMDLSKIQSGVQTPMMEFFDLTSVIREVMSRYEAFTKAQGYRVVLHAEENVPVFADRNMILQVIYNLINNAIHYTGTDRTVTVSQTVIDKTVRISVKDTGEGIPEDQLELIWNRYYKVDKVHRSARIGTGLGLSIVKGILEIHDAKYGVESRQGEGAVFWFELPVSAPPTPFSM